MHFALLAHLNLGIVASCAMVSVVVNTTAGFIFFKERLSLKTMSGIIVTLIGIIWISLAKGDSSSSKNHDSSETEEDFIYFKLLSIMFALFVGTSNAMQTIIAKFMMKRPVKFDV